MSQVRRSPKRIAVFLHPHFSDGGVERTNLYLAKGLREAGYEVAFLTTSFTEHYVREVHQLGILLWSAGAGSMTGNFYHFYRILRDAASQYETVYVVGCQYYVNIVGLLLKALLTRRCHNMVFVSSERNHIEEFKFRDGLKNRLIPILVRIFYRHADVVIANSVETARDLAEITGREVIPVYNPTINDRLEGLRSEVVDETWFCNDPRPCVLAVGRLSAQKDFTTLIKAFKLVRRQVDAKLVILGEGEERLKLEQQISNDGLARDIYLPGFVDNPYKFMQASSLFVLSSRYEGLPNALIEAIYLGVPCVATQCKSGPQEILLGGKAGYLVPVGDFHAMSEAILKVFTDPAGAEVMNQLARSGIERFRPQRVVPEFERAINSSLVVQ